MTNSVDTDQTAPMEQADLVYIICTYRLSLYLGMLGNIVFTTLTVPYIIFCCKKKLDSTLCPNLQEFIS